MTTVAAQAGCPAASVFAVFYAETITVALVYSMTKWVCSRQQSTTLGVTNMDELEGLDLSQSVWGSLFGSPADPIDPPVIGFRICKIADQGVNSQGAPGPRLYGIGVGSSYKWLGGENIAGCSHSRTMTDLNGNIISQGHAAPQLHCGCGLHACTDLTMLDKVTGGLKSYSDGYHVLAGVIGWGKVLEFEKGFRAEKAQVVAICDAFPGKIIKDTNGKVIKILSKKTSNEQTLGKLSAYYNCPVVGLRDLEAVVREHGTTLGS
jgi:hypothetical protein